MIDELAKALCGAANEILDWRGPCGHSCEPCRAQALAVLRRLREPTPEMVEAARALGIGPGPESIAAMYRAMIDAAMKPDV